MTPTYFRQVSGHVFMEANCVLSCCDSVDQACRCFCNLKAIAEKGFMTSTNDIMTLAIPESGKADLVGVKDRK